MRRVHASCYAREAEVLHIHTYIYIERETHRC
uniref:Uncharacterized protein n=1 Tax=Arundo donax TaxID=35708 RepID=A0A0A9A559_ARUDO